MATTPFFAAVTILGVFLVASHYPWPLALLTSTAIGALVYSAQSTWENLRDLDARFSEPAASRRAAEAQSTKLERIDLSDNR